MLGRQGQKVPREAGAEDHIYRLVSPRSQGMAAAGREAIGRASEGSEKLIPSGLLEASFLPSGSAFLPPA